MYVYFHASIIDTLGEYGHSISPLSVDLCRSLNIPEMFCSLVNLLSTSCCSTVLYWFVVTANNQCHTKYRYCAKAKCMVDHANAFLWVHAQNRGRISPQVKGPSTCGEIGPESHRPAVRKAFAHELAPIQMPILQKNDFSA